MAQSASHFHKRRWSAFTAVDSPVYARTKSKGKSGVCMAHACMCITADAHHHKYVRQYLAAVSVSNNSTLYETEGRPISYSHDR
jgi:hypothetical protein